MGYQIGLVCLGQLFKDMFKWTRILPLCMIGWLTRGIIILHMRLL